MCIVPAIIGVYFFFPVGIFLEWNDVSLLNIYLL